MFSRLKKKLTNIFFSYGGKNVNNKTVNYLFSPIYFLIIYTLSTKWFHLKNFDPTHLWSGAIPLCIGSTLFYMYCSTFFQPDLDVDVYRPGYHTFPFGTSVKKFKLGSIVVDLFKPLTWFWRIMWHPYAALLTHRGAGHWPIIGVWLRVAWVYVWLLFFEGIAFHVGYYPDFLVTLFIWTKAFFPWNQGFGSIGFFLFCFPVYIGDIFHSVVDLMEAYKKGVPFCPAPLKRGILIRIWKWILNAPEIISSHLRTLK